MGKQTVANNNFGVDTEISVCLNLKERNYIISHENRADKIALYPSNPHLLFILKRNFRGG